MEELVYKSAKTQLIIENAQTDIKMLCKTAVLSMMSKDVFLKEIKKIVNEAVKEIDSEKTIEIIKKSLPIFAIRIYAEQKNMINSICLMSAMLLSALRRHEKGAEKLSGVLDSQLGEALKNSPYFRSQTQSIIKEIDFNRAVPIDRYFKEYNEQVKAEYYNIINTDAKEDYSSNVNLRNIAEMNVRFDNNIKMIDKLKTSGTKLVYIQAHANCSERCEKYQVGGKMHPSGLYSLDGTSGEINGKKYVPLEFATDNPVDRYVTKAGKVYRNGCITGFNCRHKLIPYREGERPEIIPKKIIQHQRTLETAQREYEREIRKAKDGYAVLKDVLPIKAKLFRKQAIKLNKEYEAFSRKHGMPFFRERTRIFD